MSNKIIQKLLKRATELESLEIPEELLTEISLEKFIESRGDIIETAVGKTRVVFFKDNFYKKHGSYYFRTNANAKEEKEEEGIDKINKWLVGLKEFVVDALDEKEQRIQELERKIVKLTECNSGIVKILAELKQTKKITKKKTKSKK